MSPAIAASFAILLAASPALAGDIVISGPWSRATVRGASVAAGYLTIDNRGAEPDVLKSAASPRAERVEIHQSREENGVMTMRALPKGVEVKPGEPVAFKPGGLHLMFIGLKSPLPPGAAVPVKLHFARAGDVETELKVVAFGATGPDEAK